MGRFELKNCINLFFSKVIHPYGRVILVPFKKCIFQFSVSAVYDFFKGTFLNLIFMAFSMSEFAGFKNIYIYVI